MAYPYRSGNITFTIVSTPFRNRTRFFEENPGGSGIEGVVSAAESMSSSLQIDCGNGTSNLRTVGAVGEATSSSCTSGEDIDSADER